MFKMAGILAITFNKGKPNQEKTVLKLRREWFWHELAARYTEYPTE